MLTLAYLGVTSDTNCENRSDIVAGSSEEVRLNLQTT